MNRKIKVGVVIDQLLPGGVQKAAIQEVLNLNKLKFKTKLIILMRKGFEKRNDYLINNVPHEFLSDRYPAIFQKSYKFPIFKFLSTLHLVSPILAPLKFKQKEFDLIISHGTTTSLSTWTISKLHNIPYFAVIHDPMVYILEKVYSKTALHFFFPVIKPVATILEKRFVKAAKVCIVDSSVHINFLKKKYSVNPKIIYLGVNTPKTIPKKRGDKIISFGRWDRGKNPGILLEIINKISTVDLIIAGTWSSQQDLKWFKNLIKTKHLQDRVKLITNYTVKDLSNICSQGILWIHPHFEAFSLSALEAASYGLPIIIPKKSGITELFIDGKHGYFPKSALTDEFIKFTKILLNNKIKAEQMGLSALNLVKKNYTTQIHSKHLASLIHKTLDAKTIELVALETGHVGEFSISGGDILLEKMAKSVNVALNLTVIVPEKYTSHWVKSGVKINLKTISSNYFDRFTGPWGVFGAYLIRILKASLILFKMTLPNPTILYSSTGILPDILTGFIIKNIKTNIFWVARIHHLLVPPSQRPGKYWVNLGSLILQEISLFSIKIKADLILVLNLNLKNQLVSLGFRKDKIVVLGGGVDFKTISDLKSPSIKKFDGVFLGRLHPAKGIFDLSPIWQLVTEHKPDAKLAVIGTGPSKPTKTLIKQINKTDLRKNILLLNFLPQKKVWQILKSSKVFLFTDHEAGFGLAVAEAMAAGLPVVGWDIGILGQVFKKGYIMVPLEEIHKFAKAVVSLLDNDINYKKLSQEAKIEASRHDWTKTSLKFNQILNKIIRR